MLEAARDNGGFSTGQPNSNPPTAGGVTSSKNKPKGVFTIFDHFDPESDDEMITGIHVADSHSDGLNLNLITNSPVLFRTMTTR